MLYIPNLLKPANLQNTGHSLPITFEVFVRLQNLSHYSMIIFSSSELTIREPLLSFQLIRLLNLCKFFWDCSFNKLYWIFFLLEWFVEELQFNSPTQAMFTLVHFNMHNFCYSYASRLYYPGVFDPQNFQKKMVWLPTFTKQSFRFRRLYIPQ